ncbi:hypothetical protein [Pararhizobium sp. A13]|uniref:hypothetical protein n=1 Tax=Pararhizobium sp. A13 TaxID=3133975 RepID=UPI003244D9F9
MAGSLRRGAGFEKGHRKLYAMSVPINKMLFLKYFVDGLKFSQRKLYAIFQAADLFLSKEENLTGNLKPECRSVANSLKA